MPDLDKLVRLAEVFGVSLDELVLDRKPQASAAAEQTAAESAVVSVPVYRPGRTVGVALMCTAAVIFLLTTLLGGLLTGLVLALPFVLWGGICLTARKRPGLWCAWTAYALIGGYLNFATGTRWSTILATFQPWADQIRTTLIVAWCLTACGLVLLAVTLWSFRGDQLLPSQRNSILLGAGWVVWLALLVIPLPLPPLQYIMSWNAVLLVWDWARFALLVLLAERTAALLRARHAART